MPVILTTLFSLLSNLAGPLGQYFKSKQEVEQLKIDTQKEIQLATMKLSAEIAQADMEKAKTVLAATGQYFKYFTFFMWFGPFIMGIINPALGKEIFVNLSGMPEWYVQSCMLIMFTVWGISVSAPVVGSIFSGLGNFFAERRDYKLEKAKIDRKAYFAALRKLQGYVTDADVKRDDAVLDELDKQG